MKKRLTYEEKILRNKKRRLLIAKKAKKLKLKQACKLLENSYYWKILARNSVKSYEDDFFYTKENWLWMPMRSISKGENHLLKINLITGEFI
jgi:hypothetical protein